MSAIRRQLIRRIHRETGRSFRELLRDCRSLSAVQMAQRYLSPAMLAVPVTTQR